MSLHVNSIISDVVLDEVIVWQSRQLDEFYPAISSTRSELKIREGHRVVIKVCSMAVGINIDGIKYILGLWIADSEGAEFWACVCAV